MSNGAGLPAIMPGGNDLSNFLSKKERLTGNFTMFVLAGIIFTLVMIFFGPAIGGFFAMLNHMFNEIFVLFIKAILAGVTVLTLMNKGVRAGLWNLRVAFSRAVTKQFIKLMPTYLLEAYANEYLTGQHEEFIGKMGFIKGLHNDSIERVKKNREDRQRQFDIGMALKKRSFDETRQCWTSDEDKMKWDLAAGQVSFLDKSYVKFVSQEQRLDAMCKIIEKFERAFRFQILLIQAMVTSLISEYESEKAMAEACVLMGGLTTKNAHRQIFDMTQTYVEGQINQFKAYTDTFIQCAPELLSEPETESQVASDKLMEEIQTWDKRIQSVITNTENTTAQLSQGNVIEMVMTSPRTAEPALIPLRKQEGRKYSGL